MMVEDKLRTYKSIHFFKELDIKYLLVDENVWSLYKEYLEHIPFVSLCPAGELSKEVSQYIAQVQYFLENGIKKSDKLFVLGGGCTSDLGGFLASTLFRGICWESIPTTLLAMIDAGIGGKTALNTKWSKNTIGTFCEQNRVHLCLEFLETLDKLQYQSGLGELIKYSFLSKKIAEDIYEDRPLEDIILACVEFKLSLVKKDFFDTKGIRLALNLGHTYGHALEMSLSLPHGLAVLLGMECEFQLQKSEKCLKWLKYLKEKFSLSHISLKKIKVDWSELMSLIALDKKCEKGTLQWIHMRDIGEYKLEKIALKDLRLGDEL